MTERRTTDLCGPWQIWFDDEADWESGPVHLPGTPLTAIQSNPPSGGWDNLANGEPITVPAVTDDVRADYIGVSWWSRTITLAGRSNAVLAFAAARLRAEVFLDGELIGHDIEGYTPFEIAIPDHLNMAGDHQLAVRITNPGGSDNWEDLFPIRWAGMVLPSSHHFGGIWQPVHLHEHDGLRIADLWVRTALADQTISVTGEIEGEGATRARITVTAPDGEIAFDRSYDYDEPCTRIAETVSLDQISVHEVLAPRLYRVRLEVGRDEVSDACEKTSAFRELDIRDGKLLFNGRPIYLATSISWSLYFNGPIATPEEIDSEVSAIKAMGQNMVTAHRRAANPELIDALDAAGLLLYQEPGGVPSLRERFGGGHWLPEQDLETALAFAELRIARLWRRDRSRPSLVWWNLANECLDPGDGDPGAPAHRLLAVARDNDDSRITTWTSAWNPTPLYTPDTDEPGTTFDFHAVLNWPSMWHQQMEAEIAAIRPPGDMPYVAGESQNFTSLAGLEALAEKAADRRVKRRFDGKVLSWKTTFDEDLTAVDPDKRLGGADALIAATARVQSHGVAKLVRHHRANADCDGLAINGWHSHPLIGTMGILRVDRRPAVNTDAIAEANAALQIVLTGVDHDVAAGDEIRLTPVVLNAEAVADLTIDVTVAIDGDSGARIAGRTSGDRRQILDPVTFAAPARASSIVHLDAVGTIGDAPVAETIEIAVSDPGKPSCADIDVFDPRRALAGIVERPGAPWRLGSTRPTLICANNMRLIHTLFAGGPRRAAVLLRPDLPGASVRSVPGDLARLGVARRDARYINVLGDWNGGWAFDTGHQLLPSLGTASIWNSPQWRLFPRQMMWGLEGEILTGAISFEGAGVFETGDLRIGATTVILRSEGNEVLVTTLPLTEAARTSPLARSVISDIVNWLVS
ncbi:glycoside hydrolase family 2 TIM barrel-domain containing protein [Bauldia sp.]|uniref:glycoside hydrolase family 2 TIM barrel-domain containing protein n=1 Tax=Bauldia sp. TaxID=2575872 RepID=UPI003BAD1C25